jgi:ubiquitin C-terminal hydrolase
LESGPVYTLHAICIHDGDGAGGHYYSFIKDHFNKKWNMLNDHFVNEVALDVVMAHSVGGNKWKTAYWLIYISESML